MKIAVAIDGSNNALRAAEQAIILAKHLPNASLEVIFVVDFDKVKNDWLVTESLALDRERRVRPVLDLAQEASIQAEFTMLKGNPSEQISHYVNSQAIDQLVLGSRGLNSFQEMVLGSVSHKVMKHVKCPVTIVK